MFRLPFAVRWADLDANAHMANTAYLDVCVDVRMGFFEEHGFSRSEFARRQIGPVVQRDEVDYARELRLGDRFEVDLELVAAAVDGSRFVLRNTFYRADAKVAARVASHGGWLHLVARRLVAPPSDLLTALMAMPRADCFGALDSSVTSPD